MECGRKGGKTSHKGLHQLAPPSILSLSPRTTSKVLKRLGIGCSNCGWDKASCDIHHMEGRENPLRDRHENLVHLCPNCHRLAHRGALEKTELVSLAAQVGEDWRKHYFG